MTDALERLKNRNRPTVPARDASLSAVTPINAGLDTSIPRYLDSPVAPVPASRTPSIPAVDTLQTKQSTMRLEQGLSDRLQALCREQGLSREVVIEALFEYGETHPEILEAVIAAARQKNEHRQQIANLKRAKSMMERFS